MTNIGALALRKKLQGIRSQNNGKSFELTIMHSVSKLKWGVLRIPDGCRSLGPQKLMRVKSPFDFVFYKQSQAIFCDVKTTDQTNFPKSKIKSHQLAELLDLEKQGFHAGYIVRFAKINWCVWFSAIKLAQCQHRGSMKPLDGLRIGNSFEINPGLISASPSGLDASAP